MCVSDLASHVHPTRASRRRPRFILSSILPQNRREKEGDFIHTRTNPGCLDSFFLSFPPRPTTKSLVVYRIPPNAAPPVRLSFCSCFGHAHDVCVVILPQFQARSTLSFTFWERREREEEEEAERERWSFEPSPSSSFIFRKTTKSNASCPGESPPSFLLRPLFSPYLICTFLLLFNFAIGASLSLSHSGWRLLGRRRRERGSPRDACEAHTSEQGVAERRREEEENGDMEKSWGRNSIFQPSSLRGPVASSSGARK